MDLKNKNWAIIGAVIGAIIGIIFWTTYLISTITFLNTPPSPGTTITDGSGKSMTVPNFQFATIEQLTEQKYISEGQIGKVYAIRGINLATNIGEYGLLGFLLGLVVNWIVRKKFKDKK